MYNVSGYTRTLASNPYKRIIETWGISLEKQVSWALEWAQEKIEDAEHSSCKGLARIDIGSAATALCEADSVENIPEQAEQIRTLERALETVCLKWGI